MFFARRGSRVVLLVALREARILWRSRAGRSAATLLFALAWLPPFLVAARAGRLGLASFGESAPLTLAVLGVLLPLLALLAGSSLFATEIEDRTIVPVLSAPVSRSACVVGKLLGLGTVLALVYLAAFASAGAAVGLAHGLAGSAGHLALALSGLPLGASCLLLGAAIGAGGRGRVRAFGAALGLWLVLVFALDAVLLAGVLATSPPPPASVGHHGHDEIAAVEPGDEDESSHRTSAAWMLAGPVDLFRLGALALSPELGARWVVLPTGVGATAFWGVLAGGWIVWMVAPAAIVGYRFRRVPLS